MAEIDFGALNASADYAVSHGLVAAPGSDPFNNMSYVSPASGQTPAYGGSYSPFAGHQVSYNGGLLYVDGVLQDNAYQNDSSLNNTLIVPADASVSDIASALNDSIIKQTGATPKVFHTLPFSPFGSITNIVDDVNNALGIGGSTSGLFGGVNRGIDTLLGQPTNQIYSGGSLTTTTTSSGTNQTNAGTQSGAGTQPQPSGGLFGGIGDFFTGAGDFTKSTIMPLALIFLAIQVVGVFKK